MPAKGSQDLSKLFRSSGGKLGLDDEASSTLIANLNGTVMPMCIGSPFDEDEQETDDFRLVMLVLDDSGSMHEVKDDMKVCVNDDVIPGLLEGAKSVVGAIRYSGLAFGTTVRPLWGGGWQKLKDNPPKLGNEYRADGATALNQAVLDAVTAATAYALQVANTTGTHPEVTIAVLSDGANNQPPMDASAVKHVVDQLSPELFTTVFLGFETYERVDFRQVAASLGFRDVDESKAQPGESKEDQRRRFRHKMKVFSSQLVKRASQSRVGSGQSAPGSSTGFWQA